MDYRIGREIRIWFGIGCVAALSAATGAAERPREVKTTAGVPRMQAKATFETATQVADRARVVPINTPTASLRSGGDGSVGGAAITVFRNDLPGDPTVFYPPGARCDSGTRTNVVCLSDLDCPGSFCRGDRMADDFQLASGAADVLGYSFNVVALPPAAGQPNPAFSVHAELWNGNPCIAGSTVITGTERDFANVVPDTIVTLGAVLPAPVAVPEKVWLAVSFSSDNAGWIQAGPAELGFTGDFWSENNRDPSPSVGCLLLSFGGIAPIPYAGFWASVDAQPVGPPAGACCDGLTCSETTEIDCTAGVWQGAFSKCDPSPCLTGACCSGFDFRTCGETTEAACSGDQQLFTPGATCNPSPCQPGFKVYENTFETGIFGTIDAGTVWADQLEFGPGTPCDLLAFDIIMVADVGAPPYNARLTLWTNLDNGTPLDLADDLPLAALPETVTDFFGVPGDLTRETLLAGPFTGITLTDRIWVSVQLNTPLAGPLLGGDATIGNSLDAFAVFNNPATPGVWDNGFWFGGFTPTLCPGPNCNPAGNFRINMWCRGETPRGACCNSAAGTCVDGVIQAQCDGRWSLDKTCDDPTAFDPPCDRSACCTPFGCIDMTPADCTSFGGSLIPGAFCAQITCPVPECIGAAGACDTAHGTPGCDNALCCQAVCAVDASCCAAGIGWDAACAQASSSLCVLPPANDHCGNAEPITGATTVAFDNSTATADGPPHPGCGTAPESDQLANDVWYCWTANCTDRVYVQTCGLTGIDTKIAAYDGCGTCPAAPANLLSCSDDFCGFQNQGQGLQSQVSFDAVAGQTYSIRVGTFPGGGTLPEAAGGPGSFRITCGVPSNAACTGAAADCCIDSGGLAGCGDTACCTRVCACDPFCCEVEWDANCAGIGAGGSGCGAAILCTESCGIACSPGPLGFVDPPRDIVDARQPHPPGDPLTPQGINQFLLTAPVGAERAFCWSLCETSVEGSANGIASIQDNGDGTLTLSLLRTISTNAVTKVTYTDSLLASQVGVFISHPGNVDGGATADATDVEVLVGCLTGAAACNPWQCDIDHSGACTPADLLREIDVLDGGDGFTATDGTGVPTGGAICP